MADLPSIKHRKPIIFTRSEAYFTGAWVATVEAKGWRYVIGISNQAVCKLIPYEIDPDTRIIFRIERKNPGSGPSAVYRHSFLSHPVTHFNADHVTCKVGGSSPRDDEGLKLQIAELLRQAHPQFQLDDALPGDRKAFGKALESIRERYGDHGSVRKFLAAHLKDESAYRRILAEFEFHRKHPYPFGLDGAL
jgi:hypothetical protein